MIRALRHYITRKRFERLFVRPFAGEVSKARAAHSRNEGLKAQREFLHAALRGVK